MKSLQQNWERVRAGWWSLGEMPFLSCVGFTQQFLSLSCLMSQLLSRVTVSPVRPPLLDRQRSHPASAGAAALSPSVAWQSPRRAEGSSAHCELPRGQVSF